MCCRLTIHALRMDGDTATLKEVVSTTTDPRRPLALAWFGLPGGSAVAVGGIRFLRMWTIPSGKFPVSSGLPFPSMLRKAP